MSTATPSDHPHVLSWLEPTVAGSFMLLFVVYAAIMFKPEHVEHHPTRVLIGAALQGLIIGILVAFVVMPFRIGFFVPDPTFFPDAPRPPKGIASLSILPFFLLLMVIRRGLLARAPLIGGYLRAYRRAALKHQIDWAKRALGRLEAVDARVNAERT